MKNQKIIVKLVFFVAVIFFVVGCEPLYHQPESGNIAYIRLVTSQPKGWYSNVLFSVDSEDRCYSERLGMLGKSFDSFYINKELNANVFDVDFPKDPNLEYVSGQYIQAKIPAEDKFFFTITGGENNAICALPNSFFPMTNKFYEIRYLVAQNRCIIRVDLVSEENGTFSRSPEISFSKNENQCQRKRYHK